MALVAEGHQVLKDSGTILSNQKGQLSIFFAMTLVLLLGVMAFVINIGLFVKAKINLQNSVDAAAWAGAAVQSRQLTNIAYLNWEMRNTYKEWMYKYYVIGQSANTALTASYQAGGDSVSYLLKTFSGSEASDSYNFPSICIHIGDPNLCGIFSLPGLPRFKPVGIPGVDSGIDQLLNQIAQTKSADCSQRSSINSSTAMLWTYGVGDDSFPIDGSLNIASQRIGAWPQAFELAIRIRNLEKMMNEPPISESICASGCSNPISEIENRNRELPFYERTIKAFYSGYRSLGNGQTGLKNSFKMYELPPRQLTIPNNSLSSYLIPGGSSIEKYYVDLKLFPLNLAIFYTMFEASSEQTGAVTSDADCSVRKVALPVPGYPFGFAKNPEVLTYYAVKGEAEYTSLLNPFDWDGAGIKIEAYAAAKPYGGRIGPAIFYEPNGSKGQVLARNGPNRSFNFISGINPSNPAPGDKGPLPNSTDFFITNPTQPVGGVPDQTEIKFAIPNLIYHQKFNQTFGSTKIEILTGGSEGEPAGMYDRQDYENFATTQGIGQGGIPPGTQLLTAGLIEQSLNAVRAPTIYDYQNYLIPTPEDENESYKIDSIGFIGKQSGLGGDGQKPMTAMYFAPIFGPGTYYRDEEQVREVLQEYINKNTKAIEAYSNTLKDQAAVMLAAGHKKDPSGTTQNARLYDDAAKRIFDGAPIGLNAEPTCQSLAGKMLHFFTSQARQFPDKFGCNANLTDTIVSYWSQKKADDTWRNYFRTTYVKSSVETPKLLTAYSPGKRHGAMDDEAKVKNPNNLGDTYQDKRNYYSTKFIPVKAVLDGESVVGIKRSRFLIYSEGADSVPDMRAQAPEVFRNTLKITRDRKIVEELNH